MLYGFGDNDYGKIGANYPSSADLIELVATSGFFNTTSTYNPNSTLVAKVDSLWDSAAFLTQKGEIYMFGNGDDGRLGNGSTSNIQAYAVGLAVTIAPVTTNNPDYVPLP